MGKVVQNPPKKNRKKEKRRRRRREKKRERETGAGDGKSARSKREKQREGAVRWKLSFPSHLGKEKLQDRLFISFNFSIQLFHSTFFSRGTCLFLFPTALSSLSLAFVYPIEEDTSSNNSSSDGESRASDQSRELDLEGHCA